uniref:Clp ATPase C-terminal domain-containing protein n=1 Tax=Haptolina ericina TaxID=156174 RepID=A0A7S3BQT2_9EUKA
MDKAHPEVFNVLLQLLDDGRLTDGQGRTVNFKNAIIILTSNVGGAWIAAAGFDEDKVDEVRLRVLDELRERYRPEFLNRLDEYVIFNALGRSQLDQIARLQLRALESRLAEKRIQLEVDDTAMSVLADLGYNPEFGARPLKRVLQRELETPLARGLLAGDFQDGDTISITADMDAAKVVLAVKSREAPFA